MRKAYPSDLSDTEWKLLEPHIPAAKAGGRPRQHEMREILNGIFYVLKSGCQWGMLPHDLPPKGTVYHYYNTWRKDGTWQHVNAILRGELRDALGRDQEPSAALVDSQSVKTTSKKGREATMAASRSRVASDIL